MKNNVLKALIMSTMLLTTVPTVNLTNVYAAETTVQNEVVLETGSVANDNGNKLSDVSNMDKDGNVVVSVELADTIEVPLSVTLSKDKNNYQFTINQSGDPLKLQPGTYKVEKAVDGNGHKLDKGAKLVIDDDTQGIYLDFTDPNKREKLSMTKFLVRNLLFIPFFLACALFARFVVSHVEA